MFDHFDLIHWSVYLLAIGQGLQAFCSHMSLIFDSRDEPVRARVEIASRWGIAE